MGRCLACEQVDGSCICAKVDKLFDEGREAEARVNSNLVDIEPDFWFMARIVGANGRVTPQ